MSSGARQAELWGPSAALWAERHEAYSMPLAEWLLARVAHNGTHILDAGCGAGGACVLARGRGARVTGTDVAAEMLALAQARLPEAAFTVADTENLPFADGLFDGAVAINSLQFTEDPVRALRELARVTKHGAPIGIACFASPEHSDFSVIGAAVRKLFTTPPKFEGPFSLSPPEKLFETIRGAGLSVEEATEIELTRTHSDFAEFWASQAGTAATRFSVRELGETAVKQAMAAALVRFAEPDGSIRLKNRFVVAIVR